MGRVLGAQRQAVDRAASGSTFMTPLEDYLAKQARVLAIQARQRELDAIEECEPFGSAGVLEALRDECQALSEEEDALMEEMDLLWAKLDPVERRRAKRSAFLST